jgi:hypothetical protein
VISLQHSVNMLLMHDPQYTLPHCLHGFITSFTCFGSLALGNSVQHVMHCISGSCKGRVDHAGARGGRGRVIAGAGSGPVWSCWTDMSRRSSRKRRKEEVTFGARSMAIEGAKGASGIAGALLRLCVIAGGVIEVATFKSS